MSGPTDHGRLFVALPLPGELRDEAVALLERLRARCEADGWKVRWSRPENLHLTLRFLGDVPLAAAETLCARLRSVGARHPAFRLSLAGLGTFGGRRGPRVLWLGVGEGSAEVHRLAEAVEATVRDAGFPPERRPFSAHLTLGRVRAAPADAGRTLAPMRSLYTSATRIERMVLYRSHLRREGPRYEPLCEAPLGRTGSAAG